MSRQDRGSIRYVPRLGSCKYRSAITRVIGYETRPGVDYRRLDATIPGSPIVYQRSTRCTQLCYRCANARVAIPRDRNLELLRRSHSDRGPSLVSPPAQHPGQDDVIETRYRNIASEFRSLFLPFPANRDLTGKVFPSTFPVPLSFLFTEK